MTSINAFQNHGLLAHRSADESTLGRECWRSTFTDYPKVRFVVALIPREVVMVVDFINDVCAYQVSNLLTDPITASIGVATGKVHSCDILAAKIRVSRQHHRVNVNAVFSAACLDILSRNRVTEATRTEVNTNPNSILLVSKNVNVVITRADRP